MKQKQFYTYPMHSEIISERIGMCSECGMALVSTGHGVAHVGGHDSHVGHAKHGKAVTGEHNRHKGHKTNIFKIKFWVSFFLSIPVVFYSETVQELFGYSTPVFSGSKFLPLILASIIFFYGGWVFIASAYREIKAKLPGMMTLILLAIFTAYSWSIYVVFVGVGNTLFWELATLITVMLLGHWIEMRAVMGAQSALKELSKLLPDTAEIVRGGIGVVVQLEEIVVGDLVLVKPGGKIPTDGVVKNGMSDVDESIATGESKSVKKTTGSEVIAGTINGDASLKIEVTKIGESTFLSGVMRLVADAQASKSRLQILSDRAAFYLMIIAVSIGGVTLVTWSIFADTAFAVERMVAVLVIACPHALGLAIPLVSSISTTKAAQNGLLVKQRLALETARNIDVVLFDKTGTLTKGDFGIDNVISLKDGSSDLVLQYLASVNNHSEHPIARATVAEARERGIKLLDIENFQRLPGKWVRAQINGKEVFIGSRSLVEEKKILFNSKTEGEIGELEKQGHTLNFVIVNDKMLGAIALADIIRKESREAINTLHAMGIKTAMITGDSEDVAKWVAGELGITQYFSRVLPEQKSEKVKLLQSKGQKVAMVGDGVNDAPALMQADLGIAIGAGTNVALESAGIILVRNDPSDILKVVKLSRLTYAKMIQNLFWAAGYNVIAIPLAAGVLAWKGILLQPAVAAALMSFSTVIVAGNAMLLKNKEL